MRSSEVHANPKRRRRDDGLAGLGDLGALYALYALQAPAPCDHAPLAPPRVQQGCLPRRGRLRLRLGGRGCLRLHVRDGDAEQH